MRTFLIISFTLLMHSAHAANAKFEFLKTVTAQELNTILNQEREGFLKASPPDASYALPPVSQARNDVDLYTVAYDSVVPEQGRKVVRTTGLLALPKTDKKGSLPLMSYQHGTVFGKYEVPSFAFKASNPSGHPHYEGAYETRYMVALYAGNGMAMMAADYFGMGGNAQNNEAYFVKDSTQQANFDLYLDVQKFLQDKGMAPSRLFLGGWSLGGLNTTGFVNKLESEGVKVDAAFTASAPNDPYAALHGLMYYPREGLDAIWLNTIVALSVFSYEYYYNKPGLARSVIHPDHFANMQSVYTRSYGAPTNLLAMFQKLGRQPLLNYFRPEYKDPSFFAKSEYGALLRQNETYRHLFKAPVRMYFGSRDEAIKESIGTLASAYQSILIGNSEEQNKNNVQTQRVSGANHRATFITAAPDALAWLNQLK